MSKQGLISKPFPNNNIRSKKIINTVSRTNIVSDITNKVVEKKDNDDNIIKVPNNKSHENVQRTLQMIQKTAFNNIISQKTGEHKPHKPINNKHVDQKKNYPIKVITRNKKKIGF